MNYKEKVVKSKNQPKSNQPTSHTTSESQQEENFPLVAIGSSAGGLEALEAFFSNLPTQTPIAEKISFIIITHLKKERNSLLPTLIQRITPLKTEQITNDTKIKPGFIYVIPPNKYITIQGNKFTLVERGDHSEADLPINIFFQSLSKESKRKLITIILSGAGTDGSLGVQMIHKAQGLVLVQDPGTARYPSMPNSAINTGAVDYVLAPDKMPQRLLSYLNDKNTSMQFNGWQDKENLKKLPPIFHLLKTHTGHDFSVYKYNTIFRRIWKRMCVNQISTLREYTEHLKKNTSEIECLFKDLLINVTSFFRNPEAFEKIGKMLVTLLHNKRESSRLRVWVPACSTGEEVYSLAIIIQEHLRKTGRELKVQIFGTDVDKEAIKIARIGEYPLTIKHDVSPERLMNFFTKEEEFYKVSREIRQMVIFAKHDLIKDPPFVNLDFLSCRNFLIYIKNEFQKKIIQIFYYSLKSGGILFLGASENISNFHDLFKITSKKWKIFVCQEKLGLAKKSMVFQNPSGEKTMEKNHVISNSNIEKSDLEIRILKVALKNNTQNYALIDEENNIVYLNEKQNYYFKTKPGFIGLNVLEMAHHDLKENLISAIEKVKSCRKKVSFNKIPIEKPNGMLAYINLKVLPFEEMDARTGWKLIIIEEYEPFENLETTSQEKALTKKLREKTIKLEQELKNTKESLQTVMEEMETNNEELKSSNEELQSANEELQSANEELETSKEELNTVNYELETQLETLSNANDDIKNLLYSTEIAVIFLYKNMEIKRFTPKATELISLIPSDIGRPISDIASTLQYDTFLEDIRQVLDTLTFKSTEVKNNKSQWYQVRIMPYRTVKHVMEGVVITFLDITIQKQYEALIKQSENSSSQ